MTSPTERSPRFHALDVWRGVVCLLVVLEHAAVALWSTGGAGAGLDGLVRRAITRSLGQFLGTPLFFVMSGYCIASCLDSARRRGTSPFAFLARRVWRIFPPYWAALAGFVAVVAGLDAVGLARYHAGDVALGLYSPGVLDAWQWIGNLTLTETWRPLVVSGHEAIVYTRVAWSICYQEQYYLVCFAVLLLAPARAWRALALVTAVAVGFRVVAWDSGALHRIDGTFPVFWHEFAIGLAVYWRLGRATTPGTRRALELGLVTLLAVSLWTGLVSTVAASAFGLLLIALHRWDDRVPGLRGLDPLRACGRRSYSLYLVHLPAVMVVNAWLSDRGVEGFWPRALVMMPAAVLASVAVAWAFHRVVERHFLDLPALRLVPIGSPMPALASAASTLRGLARGALPAARPAAPALAATVLVPVGLAAGMAWVDAEGARGSSSGTVSPLAARMDPTPSEPRPGAGRIELAAATGAGSIVPDGPYMDVWSEEFIRSRVAEEWRGPSGWPPRLPDGRWRDGPPRREHPPFAAARRHHHPGWRPDRPPFFGHRKPPPWG
jgi:peptidoglycan/LPS O-acetylase OafA/YrhL